MLNASTSRTKLMKTFTHAITTVNMSQRLYYVFLLPHSSHIMLEAYLYLHTSWDLFNQRGKNAWNESTTEQRKPWSVCLSPYFYYSLAWMVIWKGIYDVYTLSKTSCSSIKDSGPLKTFSLAGPSKWKAWKAGGQVVTILDINTHWHHTPKSRKNCQKQEITCTDSNHINNMTEIRIWKKTLKSQQVYFWHFHGIHFYLFLLINCNEMCTYRSVYIHVNSISYCSLKGTYNVEMLKPQAHQSSSTYPVQGHGWAEAAVGHGTGYTLDWSPITLTFTTTASLE